MAALKAPYTLQYGMPRKASIDDTLTMLPPALRRSSGNMARVTVNTWPRLAV
ncbi:hypothetical protein D3C72_2092670 [compost metagenome]